MGDMTTGREGAGLVKANGVLYCVGGYNGSQILDSVEMFDPNSGQWSMVAPMNVQRSGKASNQGVEVPGILRQSIWIFVKDFARINLDSRKSAGKNEFLDSPLQMSEHANDIL